MNEQEGVLNSEVVYFDVTTLMNNNGRITGITRVEICLTHDMLKRPNVDFIAWHQRARRFFRPSRDILSFEQGPTYQQQEDIDFIDVLPTGSRILLQGNAWLQNGAYVDDLGAFVRRSGCDLTLLVHDILPVSHSQYFPEDQVKRFGHCLERMTDIVSRFLVDSEATARELRAYFKRHRGVSPSVGVIRLGDGFQGRAQGAEVDLRALPEVVRTALAGRRFVLSVGSLSPHKNRRLLYDVWTRLYERLGEATPTLLIAGGVAGAGAEGEDLAARFRRDDRTRSHIHVVHGLDDNVLELLYRRSLFTVFPSLCEGWGLPVAESLLNGKICIASATSSMVEIAPKCTDLLDPLDTIAWVEKAAVYASDPMARAAREAFIRSNYQSVPWSETVQQLIFEYGGEARALPIFRGYVGQTLNLTNRNLVVKIGATGQPNFHTGSWGAWTKTEAALRLDVSKTSADSCELMLLTAFGGRPGTVRVFNHDIQIAEWRYDKAEIGTRNIEIQQDGLEASLNLRFLIQNDSNDESMFGIAKLALMQSDWPEEKRKKIIADFAVPMLEVDKKTSPKHLERSLVKGWHSIEPSRVWSDAGPAILMLPVDVSSVQRPVLRLRLSALVPQDVGVIVNGVAMEAWSIGPRAQVYECPLDGVALESLLWVEIRPSTAVKPSALTWSKDERQLGVTLFEVELRSHNDAVEPSLEPVKRRRPRRRMPTVALDQPLVFGTKGNGLALLRQGWHDAEADHVWSSGSGTLQVSPPHARALQMKVSLTAFLPQRIDVVVNDRIVARWDVKGGSLEVFSAFIPGDVLHDQVISIEFIATAVVPAVVSDTQDGRALGVALERLWFEESGRSTLPLVVKRLRSLLSRARVAVSA